MSLFGGSLMGDLDDDPIFGAHMRSMGQMDSMFNFMSDPFGMMRHNSIAMGNPRSRGHPQHPQHNMQAMLFSGFPAMPDMNRLFESYTNMAPAGNSHSFCSSSVMTMSSGPDGRPQVYQETMSTTAAPGGVKQTQKTVCDSRTGTKKMAIGHHIGERAHIMEREQNIYSGDQEERQEFINIEEEEADNFNKEWASRSRRTAGAITAHGSYGSHGGHSRSRPEHRQLALPDAAGVSRHTSTSRAIASPRRGIRPSPTSKTYNPISSTSSKPSGSAKRTSSAKASPGTSSATVTANASATSTTPVTGNRKREHTPDPKVQKKRHAVPDSDL